jgi:hypothetical protein
MTVMTPNESYEAAESHIPNWLDIAREAMFDLSHPPEYEAYGCNGLDDVADVVTQRAVDAIEDAPVPAHADEFVDQEVQEAEDVIPVMVEEEFPELVNDTSIDL